MNTQEQVIVERPSSDIVVLKINRPQVRNALNLDVRTRLADEVARGRRRRDRALHRHHRVGYGLRRGS